MKTEYGPLTKKPDTGKLKTLQERILCKVILQDQGIIYDTTFRYARNR